MSRALYETRYYEGHGKTPADRIANHYKLLFSSVKAAANANGDDPVHEWMPPTEPWMHDLAAEHPTLRRGSRHIEHVKVWQRSVLNVELEGIGAQTLVVDGRFGSMTEGATRVWQAQRNLKADGIVGPRSWTKAEEEFDEAA